MRADGIWKDRGIPSPNHQQPAGGECIIQTWSLCGRSSMRCDDSYKGARHTGDFTLSSARKLIEQLFTQVLIYLKFLTLNLF